MNKQYEDFAYAAINIIIQDIIDTDIIIPRLIFDYSITPNINNGFYMYQNISGNIITLNMNSILELKDDNDIKTVITYGFIHEIMHMFQPISSAYKKDKEFYNIIEDTADCETINFIKYSLKQIEGRLHFRFNDIFLKGIERQLKSVLSEIDYYNQTLYNAKTIAGSLCNKLNVNFDYIHNLITNNRFLKIIFPDGREIYLDIPYGNRDDINLIINTIHLTKFRGIKVIDNPEYKMSVIFKLF